MHRVLTWTYRLKRTAVSEDPTLVGKVRTSRKIYISRKRVAKKIRGELPGDCDCVCEVKARAEAAFLRSPFAKFFAGGFPSVGLVLRESCPIVAFAPKMSRMVSGPPHFGCAFQCSSRIPLEARTNNTGRMRFAHSIETLSARSWLFLAPTPKRRFLRSCLRCNRCLSYDGCSSKHNRSPTRKVVHECLSLLLSCFLPGSVEVPFLKILVNLYVYHRSASASQQNVTDI